MDTPRNSTGDSPPIGFAHRGGATGSMENTISAFSVALRRGTTGVESDAWITSDGTIVLDHDGVARSRWHPRAVPLRKLRYDDLPPTVARLIDLYEILPQSRAVHVSLDVKEELIGRAIIDLVKDISGVEGLRHLWLCTQVLEHGVAWRNYNGDVRIVDSTRKKDMGHPVPTRARFLRSLGFDVLNLRVSDWELAELQACRDEGLLVFAWNCHTPDSIEKALKLRVDGLYSDDVPRMMSYLVDHGSNGASL